jgi:hypothetical protein
MSVTLPCSCQGSEWFRSPPSLYLSLDSVCYYLDHFLLPLHDVVQVGFFRLREAILVTFLPKRIHLNSTGSSCNVTLIDIMSLRIVKISSLSLVRKEVTVPNASYNFVCSVLNALRSVSMSSIFRLTLARPDDALSNV